MIKDLPILSFGSCFARHVTDYLAQKNYKVLGKDSIETQSHIIRFGEGIVNTFSILQQFQWALLNKSFDHLYWFGPNKEITLPSEDDRKLTKKLNA